MAALSLVFDLIGKDSSASKTFNDVGDAADRAGTRAGGFGSSMGTAMKVAGGALLASGIVEGFKGLYEAAAESAKIGALTENAIRSTGGAAQISAKQVADLAGAISNKTGVDDEAIQSGANLLLTFTNVKNEAGKGNDIFNQTTSIMTDMAAVLGTDASGSAIQLGKALNDPVKGVSALQKVGVSFTESQKDQIKTLVATGDTLGAQKVILAELNKEFGGAAAAASTPLDKLKVNLGNLQEQIGGYLLPKVAEFSTFAVNTLLPGLQNLGGYLGDKLGPAFHALGGIAQQAFDILFKGDFTGGPLSEDSQVVDVLFRLRDGFLAVADFVRANFFPALDIAKGVLSNMAGVVVPLVTALGGMVGSMVGLVAPTRDAGSSTSILAQNAGLLKAAVEGIIVAFVAWKGAQLAAAAVSAVMTAAQFLQTASTYGLSYAFTAGGTAAKVYAAAQWLVNAALTANPIGIVVVALGALVAGFVIAYKNSETFRDIVQGVWQKVQEAASVAWGILQGVFSALVTGVHGIGDAFTAVKDAIGTAWNWIKDAASGAISFLVNLFLNFTGPGLLIKHFDTIKTGAENAWHWVTEKFTSMKDGVVGIFTGIRDTVGTIWDGLLDKVKTPIRVVFDFVNDYMIGPINSLLDKFPGDLQIPLLPKLATGGHVRGPGTGTSDSIPAMLSNGEYVIRASTVRTLGVGALDDLNAGRRALYARGGLVEAGGPFDFLGDAADWAGDMLLEGARAVAGTVLEPLRTAAKALIPGGDVMSDMLRGAIDKLVNAVLGKSDDADKAAPALGDSGIGGGGWQRLWAIVHAQFPTARKTSDYRPGDPGFHGKGLAVDVAGARPGDAAAMLAINRWAAANLGSSLAELIYTPGINLYRGKPHTYNAATRADHYGHVHLASYQTGTSFVPKTGPALLHEGEAVLTKEENAARRYGDKATTDARSYTFNATTNRAISPSEFLGMVREQEFLHG